MFNSDDCFPYNRDFFASSIFKIFFSSPGVKKRTALSFFLPEESLSYVNEQPYHKKCFFLRSLVLSLNGLIQLISIRIISEYFSVLPYVFCCRIQISFLTISSVHLFNVQIINIRKLLSINMFEIQDYS